MTKGSLDLLQNGRLFSIFLGSMLGDGYLARGSLTSNTSFHETHAVDQEAYLRWKMSFWEAAGVRVSWSHSKALKPTHQDAVRASTQVLPALNDWHDAFYQRWYSGAGRKAKHFPEEVVPLMTPLALAVWYMDDGGAGHRPNLSCHRRSVDVGQRILSEFGLSSRVACPLGSTRLVVDDHERFLDLVRPHIHPSLTYKLRPTVLGQAALLDSEEFTVKAKELGLQQLAEHFDTGTTTIRAKASQLGMAIGDVQHVAPDLAHLVVKVSRKGRLGRSRLELPEDTLRSLVEAGTSAHCIQQRFGVSRGVVERELTRHQIPYSTEGKRGGSVRR